MCNSARASRRRYAAAGLADSVEPLVIDDARNEAARSRATAPAVMSTRSIT